MRCSEILDEASPCNAEHVSFQGRASFIEGDILGSVFRGTFCFSTDGKDLFMLRFGGRDVAVQALGAPVLICTQSINIDILGDLQNGYSSYL